MHDTQAQGLSSGGAPADIQHNLEALINRPTKPLPPTPRTRKHCVDVISKLSKEVIAFKQLQVGSRREKYGEDNFFQAALRLLQKLAAKKAAVAVVITSVETLVQYDYLISSRRSALLEPLLLDLNKSGLLQLLDTLLPGVSSVAH